jgi:hypothetical protein
MYINPEYWTKLVVQAQKIEEGGLTPLSSLIGASKTTQRLKREQEQTGRVA